MTEITYPYQLNESILSSSSPDMWTDPLLYEDVLPPRQKLPMAHNYQASPVATPAWRPAKVYPAEKYVGSSPLPPDATADHSCPLAGTLVHRRKLSTMASRDCLWSRESRHPITIQRSS